MQKTSGPSKKSAGGLTRRDFVAATLAVPAAAALVGSTYKAAQSQNGLPVRKEVSSLDEAELQVFRDAVRIMRERPASDPTSWTANGNIHIDFCSTRDVENQIHFGWWFLPGTAPTSSSPRRSCGRPSRSRSWRCRTGIGIPVRLSRRRIWERGEVATTH